MKRVRQGGTYGAVLICERVHVRDKTAVTGVVAALQLREILPLAVSKRLSQASPIRIRDRQRWTDADGCRHYLEQSAILARASSQ